MSPGSTTPPSSPPFMGNAKFFTSYSTDILDTLFKTELNNIKIQKISTQLAIRPLLVDVIREFASRREYSASTLCLGVYILDVYMDQFVLSTSIEHQKLIAISCLLLAAKSEDLDELVPSIKDLLQIVDMSEDLGVDVRFRDGLEPAKVERAFKDFSSMVCKLEFVIFQSMEYNVIRPTHLTFLDIFQNIVVSEADVDDLEEPMNIGDLRATASKYLMKFTEVTLYDVDFANVRSSKVAAGIVAATRKLLKIKNYWNIELEKFTRSDIGELQLLIVVLIDRLNCSNLSVDGSAIKDFPIKDSGYISLPSTPETGDEDSSESCHARKKRKFNERTAITYEEL